MPETGSEKKLPSRFKWLWENMKGFRAIYGIALVLTIAYNAMQLTVPLVSGRIVDEFLTGENAALNLQLHRDVFFRLIFAMIGITLLRVIIVYSDQMLYEHVSQSVLYKVRNYLYDKIQRQDMTFYSKFRTGDIMTRVTGDLDAVRHMIAWVIRVIIESFSLFGAVAIYFFTVNIRMALSLLVIAPFVFIIIFRFRKSVAPMHAKLREKLAGMNTIAQENISGNRVVKAFTREDYEMDKFDKANTDYRDTNKATALVWIKYYPFVEGFADLMPLTMLFIGGGFLISGQLTMGEYVSISGLIWALANPMRMMGNIMNEFQRFKAASAKVMEIYYSEPEIRDDENAIELKERLRGKIEFKNVSFQYKDGNLPVLKNISFTAEPGETIAIMGETGCGKSSLIHLIPRFYEPTEGSILIDGMDVQKIKLENLRKSIGLATQDVLLYSDSIEGNIAYGDSHIKLEEVVKFARYSAADDFIAKMPEGYDTIIGERGVGLSGGQKQRLSLARALAVRPSILILDDTTSAVDLETEKRIQESLSQLDFDCTKIIIAQRISTSRTADRIIILKDGCILEEGSHDELVAKNGYYSELVRLQEGISE
ncbi:MAG: ABC transporter ATP-binding protein/permease [Lachnospiraceae bacterium]|nr:ABC transporter ATP-binding protein/permease [Lachnospiraceae bacterium]